MMGMDRGEWPEPRRFARVEQTNSGGVRLVDADGGVGAWVVSWWSVELGDVR